MLATPGPVPTAAGWAFEIKFDGVRAIGYATAGGLRLWSRNDREITTSYPEVTRAGLDEGLVLDGEVVALNERGRPDFGRLQHRMHVAAPPAGLLAQVAVQYVVFDLLRHQGRSLLTLPYRERRTLLADLDLDRTGALRVPPNFTDIPGSTVLAAADEQGLEGVVAKRMSRPTYQASGPGAGSRPRSGTPTRSSSLAGLPVAGTGTTPSGRCCSPPTMTPASSSTSGMSGPGSPTPSAPGCWSNCEVWSGRAPRSPARFPGARGWPGRAAGRGPVRWVEPRLVGEIEYRAFTHDGNFRHPSWRGLRPDRDPTEIQLPPPED